MRMKAAWENGKSWDIKRYMDGASVGYVTDEQPGRIGQLVLVDGEDGRVYICESLPDERLLHLYPGEEQDADLARVASAVLEAGFSPTFHF